MSGRLRQAPYALIAGLVVVVAVPLTVVSGASARSARDRDHDGLSDRGERQHRLNPRRWDTDRDRLSDGDEVMRCHTNPHRRDTDRDGLSDGYEVLKLGTDPRRGALRIRPCATLDRRISAGALFVDRDSLGGRCDDARPREAVSRSAPWCSLERADAAAGGGRTVFVRRGSYPKLELRGKRSSYLTLKPFRGERVTLAGVAAHDSSFPESGEYAGDAGYVRLEGFRISGPVELFGSRKIQLIANNISSYLYLRLTRDVLIERNHIHDTPLGARAIGADGYAENPSRAGIHGLTIRGNLIERATYDAIAVYNGAYGLLIERNEISHILRSAGSDLHVDAIQTLGGGGVVIRDNFIHDCLAGMTLIGKALERLVVENNVVARTEGWGVDLDDAPGARVVNNTIWDTGAGLGSDGTTAIPPPDTSVTLRDNIIDWLQVPRPGYIADQDHNLIAKGRGTPGPHDILGRSGYLAPQRWPRFRDPKRLDYRLARGSPGIDAGTGEGTPTGDALGMRPFDDPAVRNHGGGPVGFKDMGALERTRR
jgi:parallel beta helix pectate lyase-like protein/thrombospondin type 3 repeat protein